VPDKLYNFIRRHPQREYLINGMLLLKSSIAEAMLQML